MERQQVKALRISMVVRTSKIVLVLAISFFCLLTALGNILDYRVNLTSVIRALEMKEIMHDSSISYRAITSPDLQFASFVVIVFFETLTGLLCALGAWKLFKARKKTTEIFNQSKNWAVTGLTTGFLTWNVLFMSVGGEWFGMWMSPALNGAIEAAFQIFITILVVLIYLVQKDE